MAETTRWMGCRILCREASPFVGDQAGRLMIPSGRDEVRPWLYIGFLIKSFVQKQAGPSGEPRWSGAWVLVGSNETCSSDKGGDCQRARVPAWVGDERGHF
ncbi:hypothetical protein FOYG_00663 [Fusarium oxysporum NRRL 32931]|uniref:Uncharacterized protein n=1 Tax=Fusarium oxysporum NRRL 32931 TaxID=660029 RepID=W9J133_FUSOX|nr:hypothetical protein FOYG_00663 [Fusarium oxysporum NRRL 32931]